MSDSNLLELVLKYQETKDKCYTEQIFREHSDLIHFLLIKSGINGNDKDKNQFMIGNLTYEDIFSIACLSMMKAIKTYDVSKNIKFSSYLGTIIINDVNMLRRKYRKELKTFSIHEISYTDSDGRNELTIEDTIEDKTSDFENFSIEICIIDELLNKNILTKKEHYCLFNKILNNKSQLEIAKELNLSQPYVSRIVAKANKKIKKYINRYY